MTTATQVDYVKVLRPLLPQAAFLPSSNKLVILGINLLILVSGWTIARDFDRWSTAWIWLYLPLAIVMGNSIAVLLFASHDVMHSSIVKNPHVSYFVGLVGLAFAWMPPTLWKAVHNHKHHTQTNSLNDPDRSYLSQQAETWGKWFQNLIVPSSEVRFVFLILGMCTGWLSYTFRHVSSVVLFNRLTVDYVPAPVVVSSQKRRSIAIEFLLILAMHLGILAYLKFNLLAMLLAYLIPCCIGYAGIIFYIYTNHFLCPMTEVNDPLLNSVSLKVPPIFDLLHFNFSYHTEHHLFPSLNSDYYPMVQELLHIHYPNQENLLTAGEAWRLLMATPRHYRDEQTLTDWSDQKTVACPCPQKVI